MRPGFVSGFDRVSGFDPVYRFIPRVGSIAAIERLLNSNTRSPPSYREY